MPLVDRLPPEAFVTCVGAVGSPALMLESLPSPFPFVRAVRMLEGRHQPVDAVLPLEIGGVNGLLAVLTAWALGVPLVDADPMGRAYTHVHQTVLGAAVPLTALGFSSAMGGSAYFEAADGAVIERMVRSLPPSVGGWGSVACYAGQAHRILRHAVHGSVSRALVLGRSLAAAIQGDAGAIRWLEDVKIVFEGTVTEVTRRPGFEAGGVASLRHRLGRHRYGRLDFANEYLAAYDNGQLEVCAPDIICVLEEATWRPISVEQLSPQQRVRVISIKAPAELRAAHDATAAFGLHVHGFTPVGAAA